MQFASLRKLLRRERLEPSQVVDEVHRCPVCGSSIFKLGNIGLASCVDGCTRVHMYADCERCKTQLERYKGHPTSRFGDGEWLRVLDQRVIYDPTGKRRVIVKGLDGQYTVVYENIIDNPIDEHQTSQTVLSFCATYPTMEAAFEDACVHVPWLKRELTRAKLP